MREYTPTTEEVRDAYADGVYDGNISNSLDEGYEWFDRWLAAHDAEIRRIAFVEIVNGVSLIDVCEKDAYRRGREDAAKAVADMDDLTGYDMDGAVWQDKAIAAARGDDKNV